VFVVFVQLLDERGARVPSPQFDPYIAHLGGRELLDLYRDMVVVRRLDAEATALQRQGELALWPPLLGQEAAQIGSARMLRVDDFVFSSYREHAVAFVRGVDLTDLVRVWRGTTASGWDPFSINMATPQVIIGAQTLHATGYAMGIRNDGADSVAVTYFGDGAMSEGDVSEAMVFAASFQVPVVFFCQNNQWAISEPVRVQSRVELADRATGFGIPSLRVDGNDVLAVAAATGVALERARAGGGPTFIEAVTYRMGPHTTADDPTRYRDAAELAEWQGRDPISRLADHLRTQGVLDDAAEERIATESDEAAAELRAGCLAIADPPPLTVFEHVYVEPHRGLDRQRTDYAQYLDGFAE
jgi:pyruvate dehydrogenase E1 component alpha subunit